MWCAEARQPPCSLSAFLSNALRSARDDGRWSTTESGMQLSPWLWARPYPLRRRAAYIPGILRVRTGRATFDKLRAGEARPYGVLRSFLNSLRISSTFFDSLSARSANPPLPREPVTPPPQPRSRAEGAWRCRSSFRLRRCCPRSRRRSCRRRRRRSRAHLPPCTGA